MIMNPIFGSYGAENLFRALQPRSSGGHRSFPARIFVPRFKDKTDLHRWVQELVGQEHPPEIEPGILVCAAVAWGREFVLPGETTPRYALESAALHVVIATNPEDSTTAAIAEGRSDYQYFRMDYDQQQLGPLFKEPAPHVHILVDGEPRFAACRTQADLPIADFVDFILRNYRHDAWARWLHEEWFDRFVQEPEDDVFHLIDGAFRGADGRSNLRFLAQPQTRTTIAQLRRILIEQKMERCPLSVDPELWDVVAA
jgi:hypothetical protein